mmetsp:Transcript_85154/g.235920  ORF Transcript_85154/g.235920 Transcript_85154/m.235920 type:complete len:228 (+) Transcript_85154:746-1429(+)
MMLKKSITTPRSTRIQTIDKTHFVSSATRSFTFGRKLSARKTRSARAALARRSARAPPRRLARKPTPPLPCASASTSSFTMSVVTNSMSIAFQCHSGEMNKAIRSPITRSDSSNANAHEKNLSTCVYTSELGAPIVACSTECCASIAMKMTLAKMSRFVQALNAGLFTRVEKGPSGLDKQAFQRLGIGHLSTLSPTLTLTVGFSTCPSRARCTGSKQSREGANGLIE